MPKNIYSTSKVAAWSTYTPFPRIRLQCLQLLPCRGSDVSLQVSLYGQMQNHEPVRITTPLAAQALNRKELRDQDRVISPSGLWLHLDSKLTHSLQAGETPHHSITSSNLQKHNFCLFFQGFVRAICTTLRIILAFPIAPFHC